MDSYEERFDKLLQKVEKARIETNEYQIIKIVAVSKYSNTNDIKALYSVGQRAFGENRVQDLKYKLNELDDLPLEWHFIGRLQKNKINHLLELSPALIQSIDSIELAKEIDKRVKKNPISALLQINSAKEETKAGVLPETALEIYDRIEKECPNIALKGVMSIGAHTDDLKTIQKSFEITYGIFERLKKDKCATICSMGMSGDFELAIKCGSNMIRVGSALFKSQK